MGKCVVKSCTVHSNTHNKQHGIHFHKVPKNRQLLEKWTKIIRKLRKETDWLPTPSTVICSNHFRAEDVLTLSKCVRLKKDAMPILEISSDDPTEQSSNSNLPALSQSSTISSPSPTNKQQEFLPPARHNDLLFLACKFLEELDPQYDGLSILKQWGKIIMSLDPDQRLFAKNAIDYVLSEASLRNLNRYSVRINECDPYQHSVSSYYSTSRDISSHPSSAEDARDQHFSEDQQLSIQRNKTMPRVLTASSIVSQSSSIEGSSNMCPVVFASEIGEFSDYMRTMILGINNMLKDQKTLAINLIYETAKNGSLGNLLLNTGVVNTLDIPENFVPVQ
ncbi:uncharacterized protein LOC143913196 isoform X2 [Arctopsyche grandis]|uniref:uncharacterized protein LOC143913196 isoform X2 n=1 Tax=Arctopsyche grandis TaxID=121162 RepID=UPI00406D9C2E